MLPDIGYLLCQVSQGRAAVLRLYDVEYDEVYAECLVETFPGTDIVRVADSSRWDHGMHLSLLSCNHFPGSMF